MSCFSMDVMWTGLRLKLNTAWHAYALIIFIIQIEPFLFCVSYAFVTGEIKLESIPVNSVEIRADRAVSDSTFSFR